MSKKIKPLRLMAVRSASDLDNVAVIGAGFNSGATVAGEQVQSKYKLIDFDPDRFRDFRGCLTCW